jgi:hypothetical protein
MKLLFLAAGLGLLALGAQAQLTRGVTAGYHLADVRVSFNPLIDPTFTPVATGRAGYHAGGFYRASAGLFYAQPQVWLTGLNQQFIIEDGTFTPEVLDWSLLRLDVPVEVGVKLGPLFGFVAPVFSIALAETGGLNLTDPGNGSWGGQVGVGLKLGGLQVSARYEGSLSTFGQTLSLGGIDFETDNRINQFIASAALKL